MEAIRERKCIGEKLYCGLTKFAVVSLPDNNHDEYIRVCPLSFFAVNATIYYDDNTAEDWEYTDMIKNGLEKASLWFEQKGVSGKLSVVYLFSRGDNCDKANDKLLNKLATFTKWDYYNKNW